MFVYTFRSILKSPIRMTSRPEVCAMESSSSNKSIHTFRALGGLWRVHIKTGFAFGNSISAQIVSNLEISNSGLRIHFTVSLMYNINPSPVLSMVSALSFLMNSQPSIATWFSETCGSKNVSQIPSTSGDELFAMIIRSSSILGRIWQIFILQKFNPFDVKGKSNRLLLVIWGGKQVGSMVCESQVLYISGSWV